MNDHLYMDHEIRDFRRKKTAHADVKEINELIAKFIVTTNSAFRIVENKYLIVSITELL